MKNQSGKGNNNITASFQPVNTSTILYIHSHGLLVGDTETGRISVTRGNTTDPVSYKVGQGHIQRSYM